MMINSLSSMKKHQIAPLLLLFVLLATGCSGSTSENPQQATVQALGTTAAGTATAAADEKDDPQEALRTAELDATRQASDRQATSTAEISVDDSQAKATATAFAPFMARLPLYGVDPQQGRPGWIHPPLRLELEEYMSYDFDNEFLGTVAQDFVVSSDITWNTQYGTSGCGFVLRSDGNQEAGNQYLVVATRAANGHILFGTMSDGKLVNAQDIYAYGLDPDFNPQNDATNNLTVVARGKLFEIYTNHTLIGEVDPEKPPQIPPIPAPPVKPSDLLDKLGQEQYAKQLREYEQVVEQIRAQYNARLKEFRQADKTFERGFIAMVALSESGKTTCQFDDSWLWLIEP
jgi:hypothetical protein